MRVSGGRVGCLSTCGFFRRNRAPCPCGRNACPSPRSAYAYTASGASPVRFASSGYGVLGCRRRKNPRWHFLVEFVAGRSFLRLPPSPRFRSRSQSGLVRVRPSPIRVTIRRRSDTSSSSRSRLVAAARVLRPSSRSAQRSASPPLLTSVLARRGGRVVSMRRPQSQFNVTCRWCAIADGSSTRPYHCPAQRVEMRSGRMDAQAARLKAGVRLRRNRPHCGGQGERSEILGRLQYPFVPPAVPVLWYNVSIYAN